jgi:hypothetical protein
MNRFIPSSSAGRFVAWSVVPLLALVSLGCGGSKKATVTGNINYRGRPLPAGTVTFFNASKEIVGNGSIANGSYSIANVPVGPVKIAVTTPPAIMADRKHPAPQDMPGGGSSGPIVAIPPRYGSAEQSGLTYDVHAGAQDHPIELN